MPVTESKYTMAGKGIRTYDIRGVRQVTERAKKMMNTYNPKLGYAYPSIESQTKSVKEREGSNVTERALGMIKSLPRVTMANIKDLPSARKRVGIVIFQIAKIAARFYSVNEVWIVY